MRIKEGKDSKDKLGWKSRGDEWMGSRRRAIRVKNGGR